MSAKKRRRRSFSPEEKAAILRRHLAVKVSVSELADEVLHPAQRAVPVATPATRQRELCSKVVYKGK
jgi:hypothetical protein